jgi:hypothetical protein
MSHRRAPRAALAAALGTLVAVTTLAAVELAGARGRTDDRARLVTARGADDPVRLTVTFTRRPGERRVAHLRCTAARASADGFLRDPGARRACAHARSIAGMLASDPDPNRACAEIYGGPERARVTGRIGGRRIARGFSRTDGCEIADWRRAMPLLPRPG